VTTTFTMLGLPTIQMHVAVSGKLGQLDARLWEIVKPRVGVAGALKSPVG